MHKPGQPCLPPPDFRIIEYASRGFGATIALDDRKQQKLRDKDISDWSEENGVDWYEAERRWEETGCWHINNSGRTMTEITMQDFLNLLPEGIRDDREIINALDRLCLRFAQEGRAVASTEQYEEGLLADALRRSWATLIAGNISWDEAAATVRAALNETK